MTNNISNQELLEAINSGFDGVQKQFGIVNGRLDNIEKDVEDIKLRLTNVAYRFEIEELKNRFILMEEKFEKKIKLLEKKIS